MSIDQLGHMRAQLVEDLWVSYNERIALNRVEADHRATRNALLSNGMVESSKVEELLEKLHEEVLDARADIIHRDRPMADTGVSEDGFVTHEWWKTDAKE